MYFSIIRFKLIEKGFKEKSQCAIIKDEMIEYLFSGLEKDEKDVYNYALTIKGMHNKTTENNLLWKRKELLDECFGKDLPTITPAIIEGFDIDAEMVKLADGELAVSSKCKNEEPSTIKPSINVCIQHKDRLETFIINDKAGMVYKYACS